APPGQRAQLEKRGVAVEQELDAIADDQLASLAVARHAPLAATAAHERLLYLDLGEEGQHVPPVLLEALRRRVDAGSEPVHVCCPGGDVRDGRGGRRPVEAPG